MMKLGTILIISFFVIGLVPLAISNFIDIQFMKEEVERVEELVLTDGFETVEQGIREWAGGMDTKERTAQKIAGMKTSAGRRDISSSIFKEKEAHGFAWDLRGNAIIHPFYEGINYKDIPDPEYEKFVSQILETRQGLIDKTIRDPVTGESFEARCKYEYFEPLKLVIGYTEDLEEHSRGLREEVRATYIELIVATIVIAIVSVIFSREVNKSVEELRKREVELSQTLAGSREVLDKVAQKGDLSARIDMETMSGKYKQLGEDINKIVDSLQSRIEVLRKREKEQANAVSSLSKVLSKTVQGDLSARVDTKGWSEELATIGMTINTLIESLEFEKKEKS